MSILEYMKNNLLYLDGGMGTLLQDAGLPPGEFPERWNITNPEIIQQIHRSYYDAGSNVINTNTFGANGLKFSNQELEQIVKSAVNNAKIARDTSSAPQEKFIALDIGPCGKLLKPYGDLDFEDAVGLFSQVITLGAAEGVDLIFIETMNDSYETKAALLAAKESCHLPVFVSNAYGEDGKLMTGASPSAMAAMLEGMGADAIGANCSLGPDKLSPVIEELLNCSSVPVLLKPNAGLPKEENGKAVYDVSAKDFAAQMEIMIKKGVRIAGGCCGTTPEYIKELTLCTDNIEPVPVAKKNITCVSSYTHAVQFGSLPLLIGERINPTGKKKFKEALINHDIDYLLQEGVRQQDAGVHILDVNVGLPDIDEVSMLKEAVCSLQAIIDLPLQIDTADPDAMEQALRYYNGKAMINSVNGKEESMRRIFPLVKKYGGLVVALTLDEGGIPKTADGRVAIAEKILKTASEYGIDKKDIIFDTLAMTISADNSAAIATLEALETIKNKLGCHTSLGVSNISFGLPERDGINSTFFAMAMERGLSAAIMNPYSWPMLMSYRAYCALHGLDENCAQYIEFASRYAEAASARTGNSPATASQPASMSSSQQALGHDEQGRSLGEFKSPLQRAIVKGLKEQASEITREILSSAEALDIIQEEIIPALDIVGKGFEEKTVYLPQLLMSAEAAKNSFEVIKEKLTAEGGQQNAVEKCTVVIATVHGDIHDIGKNIVKLLLDNYGFKVIDLGKDVPAEEVVKAVIEHHAPIAGLSALMTTTVPAMEQTIKMLKEQAPWCKIVVGGAVLNQEYADKINSDKYAKDAMETVRYADSLL